MSDEGKLLLVVDDDTDFVETLTLVLESRGYRVVTAASGEEALERLREGSRPALILLDLMMPGIHGWSFREQQLAMPVIASIPVVVLSGDHAALKRMSPGSWQDCLPKPVELATLLATVARHASA